MATFHRKRGTSKSDRPVEYVQIDGLVALKIIKHCQEEGAGGTDLVQGVLLGLVEDDRLEVTNCFPFPRHSEEEDFDEVDYQMDMMKKLRSVNVDHLHVGWYQSTYFGMYLNRALLDSQFNYQQSIEESIVLIYDPLRTSKGHLSLKALRLTRQMMALYAERDFSSEAVKKSQVNFESLFDEIPIVVKNSHLVNSLCCELEEMNRDASSAYNFLDLATGSVLEKNLRLLMECVDEMSQDANRYVNFQRQNAKQTQAKEQYLAKRKHENAMRKQRGEEPLPDEDINKLFKPLQAPPRLEALLWASQISCYTDQITEFATQSFGKLFMADSVQHKADQ